MTFPLRPTFGTRPRKRRARSGSVTSLRLRSNQKCSPPRPSKRSSTAPEVPTSLLPGTGSNQRTRSRLSGRGAFAKRTCRQT